MKTYLLVVAMLLLFLWLFISGLMEKQHSTFNVISKLDY